MTVTRHLDGSYVARAQHAGKEYTAVGATRAAAVSRLRHILWQVRATEFGVCEQCHETRDRCDCVVPATVPPFLFLLLLLFAAA